MQIKRGANLSEVGTQVTGVLTHERVAFAGVVQSFEPNYNGNRSPVYGGALIEFDHAVMFYGSVRTSVTINTDADGIVVSDDYTA